MLPCMASGNKRSMTLEGADLGRLFRTGFAGIVISPEDERYEKARAVWNGTVDARPAVIAQCRTAEDVAAGVNLARTAGCPLSIRAGGHSVAGFSLFHGGGGIDLSLMRRVTLPS